MNIDNSIKNLQSEAHNLDFAGFKADFIAIAELLHKQNFCKPDVVRCKELLVQMMNEEQQLAKNAELADDETEYQHKGNIKDIKFVLKLLEERPAL